MFHFSFRYGGELVLIGDYSQNNFTSKVAIKSLRDLGEISYWIGKRIFLFEFLLFFFNFKIKLMYANDYLLI